MIEIKRVTKYDEKLAKAMGELLKDLSSKATGAPISQDWLEQTIASPLHDQLVAFDGEKLVGMATVSIILGAKIDRNEYLEDFVVSKDCQGKGIGGLIWAEIIAWGKEKGAKRLEFTSSGQDQKSGAVSFYLKKGAIIRDTNFFRFELQ